MKNKCLLLSTISTFQTPLTTLTNSAMMNGDKNCHVCLPLEQTQYISAKILVIILLMLKDFWGFLKVAFVDLFFFLKRAKFYLFFSRWVSLCLHFCMISVLLFNAFVWSSYMMNVFSSRQRLHLPDSLLYAGACLMTLQLMSKSIPLLLSFQM